MSSDVISCLHLDRKFKNQTIVVKEINSCDSSFIINCVLSHSIKNNISTVIILTHNSVNHYQNVGLKMNYNLQRHIESGLLEFYNLGEEAIKDIFLKNETSSLHNYFLQIQERVLAKQQNGNVNIILEGVSHLFDLKYSLKDVNAFCKNIFKLQESNESSFVLCHCNIATEDDVTHAMANLLAHKAHTVVEVETLASGWSTDVSGHLNVYYPGQKFDSEYMFSLDLKPNKYLFKLFDRGVKLLAPGSV